MYVNNPYSAFPDDLGGSYYRYDSEDGIVINILTIQYMKYSIEDMKRSIDRGIFKCGRAYRWISELGRPPRNDLYWLYRLEKFSIRRDHFLSQTQIADYAYDVEIFCFDDFNEMVDFCLKKCGVSGDKFTKPWKIEYPPS